jgi:hypothetical protein
MLPHGSPHPTELSIRGFGPRFLSPWPLQPRAPDGAGPFFMKLRDPTAALQRPPSMMRLPGIPACGNRSESATRKAAKDLWSDQPVHQCFESVRFFVEGCPTSSCIMGQMPLAHRRNRRVLVPCFPHPKAVRLQRSGCFNYVTHKHLNFNHKMSDSRCKSGYFTTKMGVKTVPSPATALRL